MQTNGIGVTLFGLDLYTDGHDGATIPDCMQNKWRQRVALIDCAPSGTALAFNAPLNASPTMMGF